MRPALYIYGAAGRAWPAGDGPPDLKEELQAAWGKPFRRVNHFIELALVGAKSCLAGAREPLNPDCEVYLATEHGNVADVARITETIFKGRESPMPLEFLNVPNNMAGFYVAQGLGLRSTNLTLAHRAFAFESALELAAFNMSAGAQALVGGVEACAYPLDVHRRRLGLAAEAALAECSSWLHVGTAAEGASARCEWVGFFPHRGGLLVHLEETHLPGDVRLAGGRGMDGARLAALARAAGIDEHYDCRAAAHGDAHCAHAVASFIAGRRARALLYVDRDPGDRYAAVCVSLTAPD